MPKVQQIYDCEIYQCLKVQHLYTVNSKMKTTLWELHPGVWTARHTLCSCARSERSDFSESLGKINVPEWPVTQIHFMYKTGNPKGIWKSFDIYAMLLLRFGVFLLLQLVLGKQNLENTKCSYIGIVFDAHLLILILPFLGLLGQSFAPGCPRTGS